MADRTLTSERAYAECILAGVTFHIVSDGYEKVVIAKLGASWLSTYTTKTGGFTQYDQVLRANRDVVTREKYPFEVCLLAQASRHYAELAGLR